MKTFVPIVLGVLVVAWPCLAQDAELKTMSEAGITVSYPPKMESQAKKVLAVAKTSIAPSVEIHRQLITLLADADELASDITSLMGCEELKEKTRIRLLAYKDKSDALAQVFANIRLVETAEGVSKGGVDAGVLQVRYVSDADDFRMALVLPVDSPDRLKRSYFPVFVNADGSIRAEKKIADFAVGQLGTNKAILIAPVHEAAGYLITEEMKLYHPFTRWFNEGVSGWVTRRVMTKRQPELKSLLDEVFSVSAGSKKLAAEVNLPAWPQPPYQNRREPDFKPTLEAAQTQYAVELISAVLGGNRGGELAKIMIEVKYKGHPDTDAICEAVKKVTGVDIKPKLAKYVRESIRRSDPKRLVSQAEKLTLEKKWKDAAAKLRQALEANPADVNARLNLAWVEREFGERADSELQVFTAAALLRQKEYSIHLFAGSIEGNYVLGRLAILVGNLESARKFLEPVLELNPNHKDAKRALEEINKLERATGASGG